MTHQTIAPGYYRLYPTYPRTLPGIPAPAPFLRANPVVRGYLMTPPGAARIRYLATHGATGLTLKAVR